MWGRLSCRTSLSSEVLNSRHRLTRQLTLQLVPGQASTPSRHLSIICGMHSHLDCPVRTQSLSDRTSFAQTYPLRRPRKVAKSQGWCKGPRPEVAGLLGHLTWNAAAEILEVSNHEHLVEVTKLMGHTQPRAVRGRALCIERHLKSCDVSEEFRRQTYFFLESTFILPDAQGCVICQLLDTHRAFVM